MNSIIELEDQVIKAKEKLLMELLREESQLLFYIYNRCIQLEKELKTKDKLIQEIKTMNTSKLQQLVEENQYLKVD